MIRPFTVLALALAACESGSFTGSPTDFDCLSSATLTATIGSTPYAAECVEASALSDGLTVGSYHQSEHGPRRRQALGRVLGPEPRRGHPVTGGTFLTYAPSPVVNGEPTTTLVASSTGQVTESSASCVAGTFSFTVREENTPPGGTPSPGTTVRITGAFSVPL